VLPASPNYFQRLAITVVRGEARAVARLMSEPVVAQAVKRQLPTITSLSGSLNGSEANDSQTDGDARLVPPVDEAGTGELDLRFGYLVPAAASAEIAALTIDEGRV